MVLNASVSAVGWELSGVCLCCWKWFCVPKSGTVHACSPMQLFPETLCCPSLSWSLSIPQLSVPVVLEAAHPSALQPSLPPGCSPVVTSPFSLGLSPALKAHQCGTSRHSMGGIWAGQVLQGRETATSNSCPSFNLHAKDGKIMFPFAFK